MTEFDNHTEALVISQTDPRRFEEELDKAFIRLYPYKIMQVHTHTSAYVDEAGISVVAYTAIIFYNQMEHVD